MRVALSFSFLTLATAALAASPAAAPASSPPISSPAAAAPSAAAPADTPPDPDELYELGQSLFEQFAPPEIKEQYAFPSKQQWDEFVARLQHALANDDLTELADYEPQARAALATLRAIPGGDEYADWLQERLDYIQAAKQLKETGLLPPAVAETAPSSPPSSPASPEPPPSTTPAPPAQTPSAPPAASVAHSAVPHYDLWLKRVQDRPQPAGAADLMPTLRAAFIAEGVPPELAWLAEAESTLNPAARSPSGARGLFQMMPETAKHLGLSTFLPDERTDPEKSAHAAARYLKTLHTRFGSWPLALAAYNAGEGRISRALKRQPDATFAQIAGTLPAETRMYVPKVCALVAVRTGTPADRLPAPGA